MPRGGGRNRRSGRGGRGKGGRGGNSHGKKKADDIVDDAAIISPTNQLQLTPPRHRRYTAATKRSAASDTPLDTTPSRIPHSSRLKRSGGTIKDIKVVDVKLVKGGAGKEDYYIGIYKLFYEGCNSSTGKVGTTKSTCNVI